MCVLALAWILWQATCCHLRERKRCVAACVLQQITDTPKPELTVENFGFFCLLLKVKWRNKDANQHPLSISLSFFLLWGNNTNHYTYPTIITIMSGFGDPLTMALLMLIEKMHAIAFLSFNVSIYTNNNHYTVSIHVKKKCKKGPRSFYKMIIHVT